MQPAIIRLDYDDDAASAAEKIGEALKAFGITLEWVEGERDGYELYEVRWLKK